MAPQRRVTAVLGYTGFRWLQALVLDFALIELVALWIVIPIAFVALTINLYDFSFYYVAALALRLNPHANIYDPSLLPSLAHAHHLFYGFGQFGYPLFLPLALIPLSLLPYHAAAALWMGFNLLLWMLNVGLLSDWLYSGLRGGDVPKTGDLWNALAAAWVEVGRQRTLMGRARATWRRLSDPARFALALGLFVGVGYMPIIDAQLLGQASMLMLTCFLVMFWLLRRGHDTAAGLLLSIVILIKLFPAILLLYFLLLRRWRVLLGVVGSLAAVLAGMTAVVGVSGMLSMRSLVSVIPAGSFSGFTNEALGHAPAWLAYALGGRPTTVTAVVGALLIALVAAAFSAGLLLWRRRLLRGEQPMPQTTLEAGAGEYLAWGWALCTMFLVTPVSEEHYDIWLLPAMLFCLGYTARMLAQRSSSKRGSDARATLLMLGAVFALGLTYSPLPFGFDRRLGPGLDPYLLGQPLRPIFMLVRPLAGLFIWLVTGILLLRLHAQAPAYQTRRDAAGVADMAKAHAVATVSADDYIGERAGAVLSRGAAPAETGVASWRALRSVLVSVLAAVIAWQLVIQLVQAVAIPALK